MPVEARWFIRTALLYLALGLGLGLVRAAQTAGLLPGVAGALWLPQLHVLTVGWLTQLIFGVAFWLFPRSSTDDWGSIAMWGAYGLLNVGLVLRLVSEPAGGLRVSGLGDWWPRQGCSGGQACCWWDTSGSGCG